MRITVVNLKILIMTEGKSKSQSVAHVVLAKLRDDPFLFRGENFIILH